MAGNTEAKEKLQTGRTISYVIYPEIV